MPPLTLAVGGAESDEFKRQPATFAEALAAADPASVEFFHRVGLDYVSCSPFRVPVARLEAGRASLEARGTKASDTR